MRILYDHQIFMMQPFGGISRYFNELMQVKNNEIEINKLWPGPQIEAPKLSLTSRGTRFIKRKLGQEIPQINTYDTFVKNTIEEKHYNLFHPTYYDPYFLELTNKPFVLTVYDMIHEVYKEYFDGNDNTSHRKRLLCDKATEIIAISENTKHDLQTIFNIPEEKIHAILLASDFDKVQPSKPHQVEGINKYILFTGLRTIYKNFYLPLIALSEILKADKDLQVLCTGYEFTESELTFFKDLGIENQVKHVYLKNDRELAWAYQNAEVFIFPSLYEGFGFPLLEAFASDCPAITSGGGSLKEIGEDAALYFNPKDCKSIQDTAYKALYDTETREELISKGRKQYKKFSWDQCRLETFEVYKKACAS